MWIVKGITKILVVCLSVTAATAIIAYGSHYALGKEWNIYSVLAMVLICCAWLRGVTEHLR